MADLTRMAFGMPMFSRRLGARYSTSPTVTSELKVVGDSQSAKVQYEP